MGWFKLIYIKVNKSDLNFFAKPKRIIKAGFPFWQAKSLFRAFFFFLARHLNLKLNLK